MCNSIYLSQVPTSPSAFISSGCVWHTSLTQNQFTQQRSFSINRWASATVRPRRVFNHTNWMMNTTKDDDETKPTGKEEEEMSEPHDIPQSAVDWNSEWTRFQKGGMRSMAPEGRQPVSKQEKVKRQVEGRLRRATSSVPSRQQLFADWRFWAALILALSLFSAFVNSTTTSTAGFAGSI